MRLPVQAGRATRVLSDPGDDRHEPHERREERETEGEESREGDERCGPQCAVHARVIGVAASLPAVPVGVISH